MKPLAALANGIWLSSNLLPWLRFRRALHNPARAQAHILHRLLSSNAASAYGQVHGFGEIQDYVQFKARVPIVTYEDLEPWIRRIMQGETAVLTEAPVTRLVPTSGSSGARKLIPFTACLQSEFNAAIGPWMVDLCRQHPSAQMGPSYWSISPNLDADPHEPSTVPIGFEDDSAYLGGLQQRLVKATFAVPSALRLVTHRECSRYLTLLCLLRQPELSLISIWHPSFFTLLLDHLPSVWSELLQDIWQGGCRRAASLPLAVRDAVSAAPQPERAAMLRSAGPANFSELWPHLSVVSCWGDAQAALPLHDLQRRLPHVAIQPKGLLATEGCVSIPFGELHPIAICSHFYEFADSKGAVHRAHELQRGETYSVIITTGGGLWRYNLGDLVEVDGIVGSTPSLLFVGRGRKVSDLCGEKLHESFVSKAIAEACTLAQFTPPFAMLAPEFPASAPPHYVLFVEGAPPVAFGECVETELRKNPHYALCRNLGQLGPLQCHRIAGSAYETFCRVRIESGQRLGDIKPEALSLRTDWRLQFERQE